MLNRQERSGLTEREAKHKLVEYGENLLSGEEGINPWKLFAGQFKDLMVMILLVCTVVSVAMGQATEALTILVIVLVNALLGFIQEYRTGKTLEALRRMAAPGANVIREGRICNIPATQVVPEDLVVLKAGDRVPADGILLEEEGLTCDEALLTGESLPVEKHVSQGGRIPRGEFRGDMAYMGTVVTQGRGLVRVTETGMATQMGKIAGMLGEIQQEQTPLQKRLDQLGKYIAVGCLIICGVVSLSGILRGEPVFDMLLTGISLAVAAVPEGLPAIVTIALALAVNRILKRNALVRKLHAVETLGCANVICSDKTGTLTENKMTVREVVTLDAAFSVTGKGYQRRGQFLMDNRAVDVNASKVLAQLLRIAAGANNAQLTGGASTRRGALRGTGEEVWQVQGEPTEIALAVLACKGGVEPQNLPYYRVKEKPFDSTRKRMSVLVQERGGGYLLLSKGAPDVMLPLCTSCLTEQGVRPLTEALRRQINSRIEEMAGRALRVLALAYRPAASSGDDREQALIFVGLAGLQDLPRREAFRAVKVCKKAHIRTIMITGDHKLTACAIAKELGILTRGQKALTGGELDAMDDETLEREIDQVAVFARVNPGHKLRIVKALKRRGNIVAMTGDGVNDAPAVKEAHIGVAMGNGTDVTKEASSLILLDDNFATLVAAIEEGRVIYDNIRKFIRYLLSCNIGEVVTMFVGMLMGMPVVLLPIQILLVNLATDGLPAIALGLEPGEADVMERRPRPAESSIFSNGLLGKILFRGLLIGFTTLAVFVSMRRDGQSLAAARTAALATLVLTQLFHVFECKSERHSIFGIAWFSNLRLWGAVLVSVGLMALTIYHPFLQSLFQTVALTGDQLLRIVTYSLVAPLLSALWMLLHPSRE